MLRSDNLNSAGFMMGSMAAFTINDAFMKLMAGEVPLFQLLFLRGVMTTLVISVIAWRMGLFKVRLPRRDWSLIVLRSCADAVTAYFFLTALFNMPLANITAILQAVPLVIALTAWALFGEPVGWRRLLAIGVGFVGVLLIIRPGAEDFTIYSLYGIAAICSITLRDLATRRLSPLTPSFLVTLVTSFTIMTTFGLMSLPETWIPMDLRHWGLTTAAAAAIICAYLFSILVMRTGEIGFVAPFRYTGLIWAMVLGYLFFGDWPDPLTLLGAGIVVASGLFMLYREARLARLG